MVRKLRIEGEWPAVLALAIALFALLAGCAQVQQTAAAVGSVCQDINQAQSIAGVVQSLAGIDPHSALGVLWADVSSACAGILPAPGVTPDWAGMVWGEFKTLLPSVLPALVPLLVGLL